MAALGGGGWCVGDGRRMGSIGDEMAGQFQYIGVEFSIREYKLVIAPKNCTSNAYKVTEIIMAE